MTESNDDAMAWIDEHSAELYVHVGWEDIPVVRTDDLGRGVRIDYDEHDGVVGVEVLDAARLTADGITRPLGRQRRADGLLEAVDIDSAFANAELDNPAADAADLRAVTAAYEALERAVRTAADNGRAWSRIGGMFDMTGPATRQRFEIEHQDD